MAITKVKLLKPVELANVEVTENATIENADITAATITDATITDADITTANITNTLNVQNATDAENPAVANIDKAVINVAEIEDATMDEAKITNAEITNLNVTTKATVKEAEIETASVGSAAIDDATIGEATITTDNVTTANIEQANVESAAIEEAEITAAKITTLTNNSSIPYALRAASGFIENNIVAWDGSKLVDGGKNVNVLEEDTAYTVLEIISYLHPNELEVIPRYTNGYTTTEVPANHKFASNTLKAVYIPTTVTKIGTDAFSNCSKLVGINNLYNVENFGATAFAHCYELANIDISKAQKIEAGAFSNCKKLTAVTLPSSLYEIKDLKGNDARVGAFENCTSLTSLTIRCPSTNIPRYTFSGCSKINRINYSETTHTFLESTSTGWATPMLKPGTSVTCSDGVITVDEFSLANAGGNYYYTGSTWRHWVLARRANDVLDIEIDDTNNKIMVNKEVYITNQTGQAVSPNELISNTENYQISGDLGTGGGPTTETMMVYIGNMSYNYSYNTGDPYWGGFQEAHSGTFSLDGDYIKHKDYGRVKYLNGNYVKQGEIINFGSGNYVFENPPVSLYSFTIGTSSYEAEPNTMWVDWLGSSYGASFGTDWEIDHGDSEVIYRTTTNGTEFIWYDNKQVKATDTIVHGASYTVGLTL